MITSRRNEKLKLVHKLLTARKQREETGLFAVEGEDLVDAGLAAALEPVELLRAGENVLPEALAAVSTLGHAPRVVGVFRREDLPMGPRQVTLALWRVADPGNVGTIVRTADAFEAGVMLSAGCADPFAPRALRASAGAIFRVPVVPWAETEGRRIALVAHGGAPLRHVANADLGRPLTFVLGSEREGLPASLVTQCHLAASIPLPGDAESLNVAAAAAIALYELSRSLG